MYPLTVGCPYKCHKYQMLQDVLTPFWFETSLISLFTNVLSQPY